MCLDQGYAQFLKPLRWKSECIVDKIGYCLPRRSCGEKNMVYVFWGILLAAILDQWISWRVRTGRCRWTFLPSEIPYSWQNSQFGFWHLEQILLSDKLYILPFLFWVQFLRQLIGIFHFSWFSPDSRLYEMVYTNANDVDQPPPTVSDCRLVLLIRLALYRYGYITDVPLNLMFVG